MKKLKNICFILLAAYSVAGTNQAYGSQRFMNLARYATAAAARCSQAFQTIKQSKPVQWATNHKVTLVGTGVAAGLIASEAFPLPISYAQSDTEKSILAKEKLEEIFASNGMPEIKITGPLTSSLEEELISGPLWFFKNDIHRLTNFYFNTIREGLQEEDRENLAFIILSTAFDVLKPHNINAFIADLADHNKEFFIKRLIKTNKLECSESLIEALNSLSQETRSELALSFFESITDSTPTRDHLSMTPYFVEELPATLNKQSYIEQFKQQLKITKFNCHIDINYVISTSLSTEKRAAWATILIEESLLVIENPQNLFKLLQFLPDHGAALAARLLENHFEKISNLHAAVLIDALPKGTRSFWVESTRIVWFKKLAKRSPFLSLFLPRSRIRGPLFSDYAMNNLYKYLAHNLQCETLPPSVQTMLHELIEFTAEEYKKGNIVLFHGQHAQWAFFEKIFNALLYLKHGKKTPPHFTRIRFTEDPSDLNNCYSGNYGHFRPNKTDFIFTNLHPAANSGNTNSLNIFLENEDLTAWSTKLNKKYIEAMFYRLGLKEEYCKLKATNPDLFDHLYQTYMAEVVARGNRGRLIAISLSREYASKATYSSGFWGEPKPLSINGTSTTDVVTISDNHDQVDFVHQCVLELIPELINPDLADAAKIKIRGFTTPQNTASSQAHKELETEFAKVMDRIAELYQERVAREGKS